MMSPEPIHILSLGAGVQSSTLALMAAAGEVTPMPVAAVFADTGDEPTSVYRWLDWLTTQLRWWATLKTFPCAYPTARYHDAI